jgi:hypothetical protein
MKPAKRRRLEVTVWKVGSAKDFLGLTPEEAAFVELKGTPAFIPTSRLTNRLVSYENHLAPNRA